MSKRNIWFKIAVIIIIQALLLTQAEFAVAAIFRSKDVSQEAALKYQKITNKTVSLIFGVASFNGVSFSGLNLKTLFSLLKGAGSSLSEKICMGEVRHDNNEIYKVFALIKMNENETKRLFGFFIEGNDGRCKIERRTTEESTGPPVILTNVNRIFLSRIV